MFKDLIPVDYSNQRVLTTAQLAEKYGTKPHILKENFRYAKKHFKEGVDYFKVTGAALRNLKSILEDSIGEDRNSVHSSPIAKTANSILLWTEQGAMRHCKMIGTQKAWEMFNLLMTNYFNPSAASAALGDSDVLAALRKELEQMKLENENLKRELAQKKDFAVAVVYALEMSNGTVKIGVTNNLSNRIRQIKADTGLYVLNFKSTPFMLRADAVKLEKLCQQKLSAAKTAGEFFAVSFAQACVLIGS